ncbi:alpha/beta hydrolase [Wohlfahrtiimonas larvae]|uniref:Alpha/beta hydrolase n=4 Tax=Wohlfahrtiimonas larvae TaxID=1157986 RepID=A0ABP9ME57_9GAMM
MISSVTLGFAISQGNFVNAVDYTLDTLDQAESIEIMTYQMPNVVGENIDATALVLFPNLPKPDDGWRIVVWAHGTVGVSHSCAPSLNSLNSTFRLIAHNLLDAGYVVVAPDYEGLGSSGIHPYLNLESEANAIIYSVKALQSRYGEDFQGDWMVVGQSQGGQASLGAAEYANEDPRFKGAVAGAPASNLDQIIQQIAPIALSQLEDHENRAGIALEQRNSIHSYATLLSYGAFIGIGIRAEYPEFDYLSLFREHTRGIAQHVAGTTGTNGLCLESLRALFKADLIRYLTDHSEAKLMSYPGLDLESFEDNTILQQFFVKNQPGTKRLDKPVLVIQGELDTNVPAIVTETMVQHMKSLGSQSVNLILVPEAGHREAIIWKNNEVVTFIQRYMPAR